MENLEIREENEKVTGTVFHILKNIEPQSKTLLSTFPIAKS